MPAESLALTGHSKRDAAAIDFIILFLEKASLKRRWILWVFSQENAYPYTFTGLEAFWREGYSEVMEIKQPLLEKSVAMRLKQEPFFQDKFFITVMRKKVSLLTG